MTETLKTDQGQKPLTMKDYKSDVKPIWCAGCGHFASLNSLTRALAEMQLPLAETVMVSGIGCSSRVPAYMTTYGYHGIHGRALPAAAGIKLARPDLNVVVSGGDGDGLSIGGNHFIHACRRNVDMTYVLMDNEVYGMTKGQSSPTTDASWQNKLTPDGTGVSPFNPILMALAAGANYVARCFAGDVKGTTQTIVEAIKHPGFSFVQVMGACVTFRPEQTDWKTEHSQGDWEASDDLHEAMRLAMLAGYLECGVFYKGNEAPFTGQAAATKPHSIAEIEQQFAI